MGKALCSAAAVSAYEKSINRINDAQSAPTDKRRNLAILFEKKYCNRENSCLTEKETSPGYAGPSFAFYECYDRSKNEVYDITTYISEKQKIRETEACPQELQNCL